ncbi:MAG TPA: DUF5666 domain-containing protein [Candidatus Angelobacter sp.]|jgi:hypothetical protein|nr:DUF5666 domain-containing protein [Candidatus Angelobacter sp.]
MKAKCKFAVWFALMAISTVICQGQAQPDSTARKLGTVKSINGKVLVLKLDSGADANVTVADGVRIMRLAPGQTDLKSATPMTLPEIQVGDRMLVRGKPGDNDSIVASQIVVMKQGDVAQKQQHEREDWQKRGTGGIVTAIDAATGTITIAITPAYSVTVKTSKETGFLRYAPDSVKFADAQKGAFDQVKVGDQLRARGTRSADGKELTAEEIISGTFRNIAGTISAVDAGNNTITVKDVLAKKSVVVKISPDSQMRKLAPPIAQRLAILLKGNPQDGSGGSGGPGGQGGPAGSGTPGGSGGPPGAGARPGSAGPGGAPPDFQQILSRIPSVTLADLQKEDAVMVVATQGNSGADVVAITLLGGVEPILTASPNGRSAAALFSGWNLGTPGGDAGPQ